MTTAPTESRRRRFCDALADSDLPAALVTRLVNIRYLTGFTGSNAALYIDQGGMAVLCTDGRYADQAASEAPGVEIVVDRALLATLLQRARLETGGDALRLGIETHAMTVDQLNGLREKDSGLDAVSLGRTVERLRMDKDDWELAAIREACAISSRALETLISDGRLLGRTEREIAVDLEMRMYAEGADAPAFETIVAAGKHSAVPHHRPTSARVDAGDFLKIDFGALYRGYHADCTRTFVVGAEPADWQAEIYEVVRAAQRAGRHALRPGADLREVDAAARQVVADAGFGQRFTHGLGHGVGLEIHEDPFFSAHADGKLTARAPVTVEPGIYLAGRGGVRIEDTMLVGSMGTDDTDDSAVSQPELLTTVAKDLRVLD